MGQRLLSTNLYFSIRSPFSYIALHLLYQRLPFHNPGIAMAKFRQWVLPTIFFKGEALYYQGCVDAFLCCIRQNTKILKLNQ